MQRRFYIRDPFSQEKQGPYEQSQVIALAARGAINDLSEISPIDAPQNWKTYRFWLKEWQENEHIDPYYAKQREARPTLKIALKQVRKSDDIPGTIDVNNFLAESEAITQARTQAPEEAQRLQLKNLAREAFNEQERLRLQRLQPAKPEARSTLRLGQAQFQATPDHESGICNEPQLLMQQNQQRIHACHDPQNDYDPDSPDRLKAELYRRRHWQDWLLAMLGGLLFTLLFGIILAVVQALNIITGSFLFGGLLVYSIGFTWICFGIMR